MYLQFLTLDVLLIVIVIVNTTERSFTSESGVKIKLLLLLLLLVREACTNTIHTCMAKQFQINVSCSSCQVCHLYVLSHARNNNSATFVTKVKLQSSKSIVRLFLFPDLKLILERSFSVTAPTIWSTLYLIM